MHEKTLGGSPNIAQARPVVTRGERGVHVTRDVRDTVPAPYHAGLGGFRGKVNRRFTYDFLVPGVLLMHAHVKPHDTADDDMSGALQFHSGQALTPETTGTTHYFFMKAHRFRLDDATITESIYQSLCTAFAEDLRISEKLRFVSGEKVDLIIGSTASLPAVAIAEVAREAETVQLAAAPIELPAGRDAFTFRLPQGIALMAEGTVEHMQKSGAKSFAFLGYTDAYGESWLREMNRFAGPAGLKLTGAERLARPDTAITPQALKIIAGNPDAVLVVASGQRRSDAAEGPARARRQGSHLPDLQRRRARPAAHGRQGRRGHLRPVRPGGLGAGSYNQFAASIWGARLLLDKAIPIALKTAKPGTREFRLAIKQALETMGEVVVPKGVLRYSASDHFGYDGRARFVLSAQDGSWRAVK